MTEVKEVGSGLPILETVALVELRRLLKRGSRGLKPEANNPLYMLAMGELEEVEAAIRQKKPLDERQMRLLAAARKAMR